MVALITLGVWGGAFAWLSWPGLIVAATATFIEYLTGSEATRRMAKHRAQVIAADIWTGFSGAFKSIVHVIYRIIPEEFAWGLIYLFLWMGLIGVILWVGDI